MKLSIMSMIFLAACTASNGPTGPAEPHSSARPWRITLTSSGGFAGRGAGNYTIDSAGGIEVRSTSGKTCSFRATAEDLTRYAELLRNAQPESWKPSYAPANRCCDRIEYELTVEWNGATHSTEWIDDPDPMPAGLTALWMALTGGNDQSLRNRYEQQCR